MIYRDGDYFGRTVNVASRIADYARPGEVLVSGEVQARWGGDGVRFEEIGPVALKGLKEELTLYSASRVSGLACPKEIVRAVRALFSRLASLFRSLLGRTPDAPSGFVEIVFHDSIDALDEIEHIVVLMLENRSFDHCSATWPSAETRSTSTGFRRECRTCTRVTRIRSSTPRRLHPRRRRIPVTRASASTGRSPADSEA